jgi:ATP-dependent Clp protease ATP-binding subunit ClpA
MVGMNPETPNAGDLPFSDAARQLLADTQSEADRLHHEYVGTEHLLLAMTRHSDDAVTLAHLGVDWAI